VKNTWRADVLSDFAQPRIETPAWTFPDALDLIEIAAYNRRMTVEDFIGRSALAFAVFDAAGDVSWKMATRLEPPMRDLRRHNMPLRRKFGRDFGDWQIQELS
jgi:hypothetical protein